MSLNINLAQAQKKLKGIKWFPMPTLTEIVCFVFVFGFQLFIIVKFGFPLDRLKTTHMEIDESINPCDDFYSFACQKWEKRIRLPYHIAEWNVVSALDIQNIELVSEILEDSTAEDLNMPAFKHAQEFYNQCFINGSGNFLFHKIHNVYPNKQLMHVCSSLTFDKFWWPITNKIAVSKYKNAEEFSVVKDKILKIFGDVKESLENTYLPVYNSAFSRTKSCIGFPIGIFNEEVVQNKWKENLNSQASPKTQLENDMLFYMSQLHDLDCGWNEKRTSAYFTGSHIVPQVVLPYIHLQSPYFEHNGSAAKNYGALGFVIGHELAHAYSTEYWKFPVGKQMSEYLGCLKGQYNSFIVDQPNNLTISLNGEKTINEDFADNLGLHAAYLAYSKIAQRYKISNSEIDLPTEKISGDQQFFLSFAQTQCQAQSEAGMRDGILNDKHSPGRFRVVGTLQNSLEFAKAYNCPLGSKMNPLQSQHKKCVPF